MPARKDANGHAEEHAWRGGEVFNRIDYSAGETASTVPVAAAEALEAGRGGHGGLYVHGLWEKF